MVIRKAELTEQTIDTLILLSARWEAEDSCCGYRTNTPEDIMDQTVFLAEEDRNVVGYLLCHPYVQDKDTVTVPRCSKCLEIGEIYVVPEYRSKGIGRKLYQSAISDSARDIEFVTLSTAAKNYKAILHFYIEELGMNFWNARLFQKLDH